MPENPWNRAPAWALCSARLKALDTALLALIVTAAAPACGNRDSRGVIVASGHVEATEVRVATKLAGTLEWFAVEEGDTVQAAQAFARLDTVDLRLGLDAAEAEQATADADLRLRVAGARREDIAEAKAQLERAQAERDGAQADFERMQGLLDRGSGAVKARDDARTRRDVATAALAAAQERLHKMQAWSRPEELDQARARLRAAQARVGQLREQLDDATIVAPRAGIVTQTLVEQGELVPAGATLAVVTDLSDAWLDVYVAEPDLPRVRMGQQVEVRTDDGQKRQGKVAAIASTAEFTPKNVQTRQERAKLVFKVKIALPNGDGLFKPGMPAEARVQPPEAS